MTILNYVVAGLITGGLYALVAVGLTLIFSVMRVVNVAHGDIVTVGAYLLVLLANVVAPGSILALIAFLIIGMLVGGVIGVVIERGLIAPVLKQRDPHQRALVVTLGLSLVLSNGLQVAFGPDIQQVAPLVGGVTKIGGIGVANQRLSLLALSVVLVIVLFTFLHTSRFGLAIRSTADNEESARACGMSPTLVYSMTFAIGIGLAIAGGIFLAPTTAVSPSMGFAFTVQAFIVIIVGGLGSLPGALIAAYAFGVIQSLATLWASSSVANVIGPLIMLMVLLARPSGILGKQVGRL